MFLAAAANQHHMFFPFVFPLGFFILLIIGIIIFRIITFRRYGRGYYGDWRERQINAEEILKRRFINHEISEDEFLRMKEALKK